MFFNSQAYLLFFTVVFALYWSLPAQRLRVYLLLAASYFFYACWSRELALIVAATTVMDYVLARLMDAARGPRQKYALFLLSLLVNLAVLCYFKYTNFYLDQLHSALALVGYDVGAFSPLHILVPFGISFYTFEAISYTYDVYRGRIQAEKSLPHFMLFILFFPHLVAGPIVRGKDFLPQTHRPKRFSWLRVQLGVQIFLLGFVKKVALADRMAEFVDPVFSNPAAFNTGATWLAVFAYALQIYGDFSGYTDMAIGSAHMLGYKLTKNFNMPYLACSIQEFWTRWHISLSSWLRDYLYIAALGGSRHGTWMTYRNLMITMTLGGLWHGARWTFVAWGVLHGLLLVAHRLFVAFAARRPALRAALHSWGGYLACGVLTFLAVTMLWVFFRAQTFGDAMTVFHKLFVISSGKGADLPNKALWYTVAVVALCHLVGARDWWRRYARFVPAPALGLGYAASLTLALVLTPQGGKQFIYFDF